MLDRTPEGPKRSGGLGAKAESCAGGLPTEDAAKGKTCRVISPENEFVRIDKRGFLTLLTNCLLGDRADESFISARVALIDFVSVMSTWSYLEAFRARRAR